MTNRPFGQSAKRAVGGDGQIFVEERFVEAL